MIQMDDGCQMQPPDRFGRSCGREECLPLNETLGFHEPVRHRNDETTRDSPLEGRRAGWRRGGDVTVRLEPLTALEHWMLSAWEELDDDLVSGNPFLSPGFVIPAARRLSGPCPPLVLTIEQSGDLIGLGVFEDCPRSRRLPLRHLRSWRTPHSYQDGLLLRPGCEQTALQEFWTFLSQSGHVWHGVEFPRMPEDDPVTSQLHRASRESSTRLLKGTCWQRASLQLNSGRECDVVEHLSIRRARSLRRGWRQLERSGEVSFRFVNDPEQTVQSMEALLVLENMGWKGEQSTSLLAHSSGELFYREMFSQLNSRGRIAFSEIRIGDDVVASLIHLFSGETSFAFKLGWNPQYERGAPGFQLMFHTALQAGKRLEGMTLMDSCSQPGSFIEHLWPHRRTFCSRLYSTSRLGHSALALVKGARWFRSYLPIGSRVRTAPEQREDV